MLWAQYAQQATVQRWFALAAPIIALRPLSMTLSGTDLVQHRAFIVQAEQFRRDFIKQINDFYTVNGTYDDWGYTAGPELWAQAPTFNYAPPGLAAALAPQSSNFVLLLLWFGAAWLAALWAIRRTSVEI